MCPVVTTEKLPEEVTQRGRTKEKKDGYLFAFHFRINVKMDYFYSSVICYL